MPITAFGGRLPDMGGTATGYANEALSGASAAGAFSPTGSAQVMRLTRRNALRSGDNLRRRNAVLSRLMGLDPQQARVASVNADAQSGGQTADALNQAQYGQLAGAQDFSRGLLRDRLGYENQRALLKYQQDLQRPSIGGQIGGLVGRGLTGYFTGGMGALGGGGGNRLPSLDYLKGAAGL